MKFKNYVMLMLMILFSLSSIFAQEKTIIGVVTDETGPLPGVSVLIEGTTTGTETDFDGNYTLNADVGVTIRYSFVGMTTVTRTVGANDVIDIIMVTDNNSLDEVVVTALGIKRRPKELSYSITSLKNEEITKAKSVNIATAMVGKVAGLQINTTNNGVNPNTRVVLRGNRSLLGNNQALIVVDGFPSDRGVLDRLNPNDVESISVLKGANGAALYGSDATNGVVLVTTKRGKGKPSVSYFGSSQLETVAYLPELQDEFGAGGFPDGTLWPLENVAWGPRYDGRLVDASETLDNGEVWQVPYTPIKDRNKNFFNKGVTTRHGISVAGGGEESSFYMSMDQTNTTGVVPNDTYNRTNFRLSASKVYGKLEAGANLSLFRSHSNTVGAGGRQNRPFYWNLLNTPLHLPLDQMRNWRTGKFTRNEVSFFRFYENPYFILDTQREFSDRQEFNITAFADYKITDWLTARVNLGYTGSTTSSKREFGAFTYAFHLQNTYSEMAPYGASTNDFIGNTSRTNTDVMLKLDKDISDSFNVKLTVGQNIRIQDRKNVFVAGNNLIIPDFYNVSTRTGELTGGEFSTNYRKLGAYGDFTLGFKDYLFLSVTGRNDWSSTLPKGKNSFFYYSAGLSFVVTEAIPNLISENGFSFLKVSASIAKTGNDPLIYQTSGVFFAPNNFPYGSTVGLSQGNGVAAPDLNPEFTTSTEVGLEFGLFNNRFTADITAYKTNSTDQIIPVDVSFTSGASSAIVNLGEIQNLGLEVAFNATLIKTDDFRFDLGMNYAGFKSEVISIAPGVDELNIPGSFAPGVQIIAKVGQPYPQLRTTSYAKDSQGRIIVGANGDPMQDSKNQIQGKTVPDYTIGLSSSISYKNLSLYAVMDYRTGHVFYNGIVDALEFTGLTKHSATSGRQPFVFPNSSYSDGAGGYIENTNRLTTGGGNAFWDSYNDVKENYVTDATTLKLREVVLSYNFDENVLEKVRLQNLSIGLFGRNLLTLRPKDNVYTDPEFNISTGNAVGVGNQAQTAPTRQYGINLTITF